MIRKKIIKYIGTPKIFSFTIMWLIFLVFIGTIMQASEGLYLVQKYYFTSWITWFGPIPAPSAKLTMLIMTINLSCYFLRTEIWKMKKIGITITHLGVMLMLVGSGITYLSSYEGYIDILEGDKSSKIKDYYNNEIHISFKTDSLYHITFSQNLLFEGSILEHHNLPFKLKIVDTLSNCVPKSRLEPIFLDDMSIIYGFDIDGKILINKFDSDFKRLKDDNIDISHLSDILLINNIVGDTNNGIEYSNVENYKGFLKFYSLENAAIEKENYENNILGALVELLSLEGNSLGFYALTSGIFPSSQGRPLVNPPYQSDNIKFNIELRKAQKQLPFSIQLEDFNRELHPNTSTPKRFSSDVVVLDENGKELIKKHISMNDPLRYDDYVFYQSNHSNDLKTSVFAVVENSGRWFPYISSIIMSLGILIHLLIMVYGRFKKVKNYNE